MTAIDAPFHLAQYSAKTRINFAHNLTVAAASDGLHVLDVAGLHTKYSHTLGPSASFACPPLTVGEKTYAVLSSAPDLKSDLAGRTISVWEDEDAVSSKDTLRRSGALLPEGETAYTLYAHGSRLILISSQGLMKLVDDESLTETASQSISTPLAHSQLIPRPDRTPLLFLASTTSSKLQVQLFAIDAAADSIDLGYAHILNLDPSTISTLSVSHSGVLAVLTTKGQWHAYHLPLSFPAASSSTSLPPKELATPAQLQNIPFASRSSVSSVPLTSSHVLLAFIPPSSSPSSEQEDKQEKAVLIQIWDLQFSVLLSSTSMSIPIPPTTPQTTSHFRFDLELISGPQTVPSKTSGTTVTGQVALVVSTITSTVPQEKEKDKKKKKDVKAPLDKSTSTQQSSSIYVIPYSVPPASTIAAALMASRNGMTDRYLRREGSTKDASKAPTPGATGDDQALVGLLKKMGTSLKDARPQGVLGALAEFKGTLDYNTTKRILSTILVDVPRNAPGYSPESVRHLLQKKVVSSAMVQQQAKGGLFGVLEASRGLAALQESILLALHLVPDLTELEIVETLRVVLDAHISSSSTSSVSQGHKKKGEAEDEERDSDDDDEEQEEQETKDPMDVDETQSSTNLPSTFPTLTKYLLPFLAYPKSRGPLLEAIKKVFISPSTSSVVSSSPSSSLSTSSPHPPTAHLVALLDQLDRWLVRRTKMEERILPGKKQVVVNRDKGGLCEIVANTHGGQEGSDGGKKEADVPTLDQIISFITTLMDASFVMILLSTSSSSSSTSHHQPLLKLLKNLRTHLSAEISYAGTVERLRGLVEPFAVAQGRAAREAQRAVAGKHSSKKEQGKEGGRMAKAAKKEQEKDKKSVKRNVVGLDVGVYRLEELVL